MDTRDACCCGCCHIKTGALVIAVVTAVCILFSFIGSIVGLSTSREEWLWSYNYNYDSNTNGFLITLLIGSIFCGGCVMLCYIGLIMEKKYFLIPMMVLYMIDAGYLGIVLVFHWVVTIFYKGGLAMPLLVILTIMIGVGIGLNIYFFLVNKWAFQYFTRKAFCQICPPVALPAPRPSYEVPMYNAQQQTSFENPNHLDPKALQVDYVEANTV